MLCGESIHVKQGQTTVRAVTLRCRAWTCDDCAPDRKKQLTALAASGRPGTFITLTSNPNAGISADARARGLVIAWRAVAKRVKARYGYADLAYFCVFETTKKGEPHLHVLARVGWIDQRWLSRQMAELANAPIVDIRKVRSASQAAAYVAKYIGKAPHRFGTCKRYWYTQGWNLSDWRPDKGSSEWSMRWITPYETLGSYAAKLHDMGWATIIEGHILRGVREAPP